MNNRDNNNRHLGYNGQGADFFRDEDVGSEKEKKKISDSIYALLDQFNLGDGVRHIWSDYGSQIKKILLLSFAILIIMLVMVVKNGLSDEELIKEDEAIETTAASLVTSNIYVDIGGAVKTPMLAELPEGSRVEDAIKAAGGLTDKADMTSVNRAEFLDDGQKVFIPIISDGQSEDGYTSGDPDQDNSSSGSTANTGKVNINSADTKELETLTGIGPVTAQKIVDYRTDMGRFKKPEDLKKVSGIGDKTFEKLKDYITI